MAPVSWKLAGWPVSFQETHGPLETQRWISPEFLGNRLAGPSVSKKHTTSWKLSAGFGPGFLETGWLAQEVRFPTLSSLLYRYMPNLRGLSCRRCPAGPRTPAPTGALALQERVTERDSCQGSSFFLRKRKGSQLARSVIHVPPREARSQWPYHTDEGNEREPCMRMSRREIAHARTPQTPAVKPAHKGHAAHMRAQALAALRPSGSMQRAVRAPRRSR